MHTACRSSAFPPGRGTTSRSTSESTGTICSAALEAFTDGVERVIDVGSVNRRLFLNNASLGIYGEAVRQPTYRDAKARTLLETALQVLGPSEATPELRLVDDQGRERRNPAVVVVSNNPYALDRTVAPGTRPTEYPELLIARFGPAAAPPSVRT